MRPVRVDAHACAHYCVEGACVQQHDEDAAQVHEAGQSPRQAEPLVGGGLRRVVGEGGEQWRGSVEGGYGVD